jgi:outer membrane biosynthesis protein TonB
MKLNGQIGLAIGGSVIGHLALAVAATAILAFKRASPPQNDAFRGGELLSPKLEASAFGDNLYATRESGEPAHGATVAGGSVWWRWTAPESCRVELEVRGNGFEEVVGVYRGAVIGTLAEVADRRGDEVGAIWFEAEAGTTYHIAVAGAAAGEAGTIELNIFAASKTPVDELVMLLPEMFEIEEVEEPAADDNSSYLRTLGQEPSEVAPEKPQFESDRNTLAASELPPSEEGDPKAPTQEGRDWTFAELAQREYIDGEFGEPTPLSESEPVEAAAPSPEEAPSEAEPKEASEPSETTPSPFRTPGAEAPEDWRGESSDAATALEERKLESVMEEAADDPSADLAAAERVEENVDSESEVEPPEFVPLADLESRPEVEEAPPEQKEKVEEVVEKRPREPRQPLPVQPPSTFQPHTVKKRSLGTLSNLGKSALDAAETPLGRYKKEVDQAVQRSWNIARRARGDFATYGSLKVRFWIDRRGRVVEARVLKQDANPVMVDFSLVGIKMAKIPPMPKELFDLTQDGRMDFDYNIIIY